MVHQQCQDPGRKMSCVGFLIIRLFIRLANIHTNNYRPGCLLFNDSYSYKVTGE